MLASQWFRYRLFGNLKDKNIDPVLALLAVACDAEADRDARQDLDWFSFVNFRWRDNRVFFFFLRQRF